MGIHFSLASSDCGSFDATSFFLRRKINRLTTHFRVICVMISRPPTIPLRILRQTRRLLEFIGGIAAHVQIRHVAFAVLHLRSEPLPPTQRLRRFPQQVPFLLHGQTQATAMDTEELESHRNENRETQRQELLMNKLLAYRNNNIKRFHPNQLTSF